MRVLARLAALTRVGKKRAFYEREYDPSWWDGLEHQYGRRSERAHKGTAGWLCPLPVSDSVSLGYPESAGVEC